MKSLTPTGFSASGLALANEAAREQLERTAIHRLLVVEGEPDYLTWAASDCGWPTIGIFSGSWTAAFADRIVKDADIVVRVHDDEAGRHYASQISTDLRLRGIRARIAPAGVP